MSVRNRRLAIAGVITAQHAMKQIQTLSGGHGVNPASTAFAAIAHELGVSPARLAQALARDGATIPRESGENA